MICTNQKSLKAFWLNVVHCKVEVYIQMSRHPHCGAGFLSRPLPYNPLDFFLIILDARFAQLVRTTCEFICAKRKEQQMVSGLIFKTAFSLIIMSVILNKQPFQRCLLYSADTGNAGSVSHSQTFNPLNEEVSLRRL